MTTQLRGMEIRPAGALPSSGKIVLIYSDAGDGKTTSCFESLPGRILYIMTEPRNPNGSIEASGRDPKDIDVVEVQGWDNLMEFLRTDIEKFDAYQSIVCDSISYLMNIRLSGEIEDEIFDSKTDAEQKVKPLINRTKLSLEGFGGLASQMNRLMLALASLSVRGKYVVITCLLDEKPRWDRELTAAPLFKGKEFASNVASFCDLIGLLKPRYVEGRKVFPPTVLFEGDGFMCKFTGKRPKEGMLMQGPLNFCKIFGVDINGNRVTQNIPTKAEEKGGAEGVKTIGDQASNQAGS